MKLKSIVFYFGLVFLSSTFVAGGLFYVQSDIRQAQIASRVLGLHPKNVAKFSAARELLINNKFTKCVHFDSIKTYHKDLLEQHLNEGFVSSKSNKLRKLSDEYAKSEEDWNAGCTLSNDRPNIKFEYLLYSEDALILCVLSGGFASSFFYDFYEIQSGKLKEIGIVNTTNGSLLDMTLFMRFRGDMIDWKGEQEAIDLLLE